LLPSCKGHSCINIFNPYKHINRNEKYRRTKREKTRKTKRNKQKEIKKKEIIEKQRIEDKDSMLL
jgi:hypothetical protein